MRCKTIFMVLVCNLNFSVMYADWMDISITQDSEISDGDQYVQVWVRSPGAITTVAVAGGQIGTLWIQDNSILNRTGGTFRQEYYNYHPENNDGDNLFIFPTAYRIYVEESGTLNHYGGDLASVLCDHQSTTNIFGGVLSLFLEGNSEINITGGQIAGIGRDRPYLSPPCASRLSISGGLFTGKVLLMDDCVADIYGYGFVYDPDGWVNDNPRIGTAGGQLRGFWADGSPFSIDFLNIYSNHSYSHVNLHVIPEPITLSLFALGAILVKRKRGSCPCF